MSYSMSPTAQQQPAHPYQPSQYSPAGSPQSASPPGAGYGQPPAKRPRLSPPAASPNGYGPYGGAQTPTGYGNPYAAAHSPPVQSPYSTYAPSPHQQQGFNTPQPYHPYPNQNLPWQSQPPTPGAPQQRPHLNHAQTSPPQIQGGHSTPQSVSGQLMPPPPRPNKEEKEEKVSVDDLGDSLFGSGINLKEEENYLNTVYNNRQGDSFTSSQQNTSFGSTTLSPSNSFNLLTQGTSFASRGQQHDQNGALAGTMGSSLSEEDVQKELDMKRERAARARAEREQFHLNHQFLLGNVLRRKLDAVAREQGVRLDVQGLYVKEPTQTKVMVNGHGTDGIVAARGVAETKKEAESMVDHGAAFGELIALVSLGAGERLRSLVDEAHAMARARRYGDHGRVPHDFADLAEGRGEKNEETIMPQNITGSQWDGVDGQDTDMPKSKGTISYQGTLAAALRNISERDKRAEDARIKKREARKKSQADPTAAATNAEAAGEGSGDVTPAAEAPPPSDVAPKLSKKEAAKQAKEAGKAAEQMSHTTTNQTAAMMAMGGRSKKYSWMTGGSSTPITNRFAKPNSGTATPTPRVEKKDLNGLNAPEKEVRGPQWGDYRESKGIDMRDLVAVLERDGREKAALEKMLLRLGKQPASLDQRQPKA